MAYAHLRTNETRAIGRRREREDRRLVMASTVSYHFSLQSHAEWEEKTNKKIFNTAVKTLRRGMEEEYKNNLQRRKEKLKELLIHDDERYRDEIASLQESSTDRARRLIVHARRLKEEREKKRLATVNDALDRQWKLACDDLRTIDSEYFNVFCKEKILKQIEEKKKLKQELTEEEKEWAEVWEQDRLQKVKIEEEKLLKRKQEIIENRAALKKQVEERESAHRDELNKIEKEKEKFNLLLKDQSDALRKKQSEETIRKKGLCKQVVTYNENLQQWRKENERKKKDEEKKWIEEKQKEFEADTEAVKNDSDQAKKDMRDYLSYLKQKKEEEKRMETVMEALIAEQVANENLKKDLSQEKEQLAREKLMKEVYETRQKQLEEKQKKKYYENQERLLEKRAHELEMRKVKEIEEKEIEGERAEKEKRKMELEAQMETLRMRQKLEELSRLREKEAALQQEKEYRELLEKAKRSTVENAQKNYGVKSTFEHHKQMIKNGSSMTTTIPHSAGRMNF